ncbi:MAG: hypothetical protein DMF88_10755 [Acidobacteria bacterium]|nr:MAG: hypothetical protein DMF88_10755 [Acidobacteriota bacterium]
MRSDSIVFAIAGTCFGIILGWVIGTQQAAKRGATAVQLQQQSAPAAAPAAAGDAAAPGARQPPPLDEGKVQSLLTIIKSDPKNAGAHLQLANAYFDAERYPDAIKWYEESLKLDPKNPDASTDLGVSYYYSAESEAREDALQPGHRARVRQARPAGRDRGVAEGRAAGARNSGGAGRSAGPAGDCRGAKGSRAGDGARAIRRVSRARPAPRNHRSPACHPRRVAHGREHDHGLGGSAADDGHRRTAGGEAGARSSLRHLRIPRLRDHRRHELLLLGKMPQ